MSLKKVLLLLLTAAMVPNVSTAQKEVSKKFSGISEIHMSTSAADVTIQRSADASVSVHLTHSYDEADYHPRIEQSGNKLEIKEIFESDNHKGESQWTLQIPDGMSFQYYTGSGNITASDLEIDFVVVVGSGDINLSNLKGTIKSTAGSGNITLKGISAELQAITGSGSIAAEVTKGKMTLTCGSGDIRLENTQATFRAVTGSGDIRTQAIAITGSSSFATGSGDVVIALSSPPAGDLSVASGSGNAEVNFGGNPIEGEIVMKADKFNGTIVAPFDFDTTEEIDMGSTTVIKKTTVKGNADRKISISTGSGNAILKP